MESEKNIPTIQEAGQWPIVMSHYQTDNGCHLDIKAENPDTVIPAHPDWSKTTLLAEENGQLPKRLIELPDGNRILMCFRYEKN